MDFLVPKAPDDYAATTAPLTFLPGVNLQCASISIVDDAVLESNEDFTVQLTAQDTAAITINLNSTDVTIIDNDGESSCLSVSYVIVSRYVWLIRCLPINVPLL